MSSSISQILRKYQADGMYHTHVSMIHPKGKFNLSRETLEEFWDLYCSSIQENRDIIVGIAEKPQDVLPVLVDVDIKIKESSCVELNEYGKIYTEEHVHSVIQVYQCVLRNIVENCTDEDLICVLLEKDLYRVNIGEMPYVKNGFHLHFPNLFLNKSAQEVHLIPRVIDTITELNIFGDIGFDNSGSLIDKSCCTVPWLLYGCRKSEEMEPYRFSKVFNSDCNEISLKKAFSNYQIYDMKEKLINMGERDPSVGLIKNIEYYFPRIFSIFSYGRSEKELKHGLISPLTEKKKKERNKKGNTGYDNPDISEKISTAKELLPMLAAFRSDDYGDWMKIGWLLYNECNGCNEAMELWLEFSGKSDKYDEAHCMDVWDKMTKRDDCATFGTLRYYAEIDSPDKYKEWKSKKIDNCMKEAISGSHNDIAKILWEDYGNSFVCSSISGKIWYQFMNHKWEMIEEGVFLREKISEDIVHKFAKIAGEMNEHAVNNANKSEKSEKSDIQNKTKQILILGKKLKDASYKNNVMKEAAEVFYNRHFKNKLDTNPYLIAFKNGVYDLKNNIFRNGCPEDYLSKSLPIDYKIFDEGDDRVNDVFSFLEKIFPDKSVRTYFMDMSSDIFVGGNHQKVVLFWTGEGDNGKSVTQGIFEKMLGDLAIKFSTTLITGKKTSTGSANPELARAGGGVRWAVLEEPDGDEQINIGTLKSLSGNDSYWARDLFETGKTAREIVPLFKLIFICNRLPKMKYSDKATWNRIRVIPFESTFCKPFNPEKPEKPEEAAPETYEEQLLQKRFPMDKEFGKKIPDMLEAFAWILLEHRKKITIRIEPEKVRMATALYRKQNDIYRQFVDECISTDKKSVLTLTELYSQFKDWFKDSLPHNSIPIKNEVKEYFTRLWGDPEKGPKWNGYRIVTMADNIASGDIVLLDQDDLVDYSQGGKNLPPM